MSDKVYEYLANWEFGIRPYQICQIWQQTNYTDGDITGKTYVSPYDSQRLQPSIKTLMNKCIVKFD